MPKGTFLGEAEQLVLLAGWRLGEDVTGASIRDEVASLTGRHLTVAAIYTTLVRLEKKGFATSRMGDPRPVRGGRAPRWFTVTEEGIAALREARERMDRLWEGMPTEAEPEAP
jgi:DNA-binding PadR family transcriptional regulator